MNVEVCYAETDRAVRLVVVLKSGATVDDALVASDIMRKLSLDPGRVGYAIFGRRAVPETVLDEGDRVEVLRGLVVDPKDARRRRAVKKLAERARSVR